MTDQRTWEYVSNAWDNFIPTIMQYIEIPNSSPLYDPDWYTNGLIDKAAIMLYDWAIKQEVKGLTGEIHRLPNKTPLIFLTVPPSHPDLVDSTVLLYGHLDKQPPLTSTWREGLHPYKPVIVDGKLYGRGGADDGYAIFAAVHSIKALQTQGIPHGRIVIIIEASEESGSIHLIDYIEYLKDPIGTPDLIICLDSGAGNYEQFWATTCLRGLMSGNLSVKMLNEAHHSGVASGISASTFRILRLLLDRIQDPQTGEFRIPEFLVDVPPNRLKEIQNCAKVMGNSVHSEISFVKGAKPVSDDIETLLLNRTWRPTLSITGIDGIPDLTKAGNVLRPYTTVKFSIRLPPTLNPDRACEAFQKVLTENTPYGAQVSVEIDKCGMGFDCPPLEEWLENSLQKSSNYYFKKPALFIAEGGSIPFMGLLKKRFPKTQFVITGVLGPQSNAHGPNEFLHIDFGKRITACVVSILVDHGVHHKKN